ncbi:MAG: NAD kinase [Saprospiraceae bacterium]|nr:NAD kinase [Saprospiraceae bacterium]
MKIFIYCQKVKEENLPHLIGLINQLKENKIQFAIYQYFHDELSLELKSRWKSDVWASHEDIIREKPDFMICFGGDGTILHAVTHIRHGGIPIIGINAGRLGFLASIEKKIIPDAIYQILEGNYFLENRTLLQLESESKLFGDIPIALNDFTISKRDNSSMITIHTFINGDFMNSYWADGLIVSSPTGSTGYSLSCGGPILFPNNASFVITPVAPHNLNVRPVVIPDDSILSFEVEGREDSFLCTLDSRKSIIQQKDQLAIRKCDYTIQLVQLQPVSFLKTIHSKLSWGLDQRNY